MKLKNETIARFLDLLISHSVSVAAKGSGISQPTAYKWLVRSRGGDEELQRILWMEVEAPLHVHWENSTRLGAMAIEKAALSRAQIGTLKPVFKDGKRIWEEDEKLSIYSDQQIREMYDLGAVDYPDRFQRDENGDRVQVTEWLKPTDQITIKALESLLSKKYGAHQTIDVTQRHYNLQLTRPEERTDQPVIDVQSKEVFADESEQAEAEQPKQIAAGRPAKDSTEMDQWIADGEFEHGRSPVKVQMPDGSFREMVAEADPLDVKPSDKPPETISPELLGARVLASRRGSSEPQEYTGHGIDPTDPKQTGGALGYRTSASDPLRDRRPTRRSNRVII
ncbi:MAG: hypothetical protein ABSA68_02550 [Xanthobacteraceae bacterium]|jgi:hypothetical protein